MKGAILLLPLLLVLAACREKAAAPIGQAPAKSGTNVSGPAPAAVAGPGLLFDSPGLRILGGGEICPLPGLGGELPETTLAEIRRLPPSPLRDGAIAAVIGEVARTDPAQARTLLREWTDGRMIAWIGAANAVAYGLAQSDRDALLDFMAKEVPPALQSEVWGNCLLDLPPAERIPYFEHVPESRKKLNILADFVNDLLPEDPQATARWLEDFAEGRDAKEIAILAEYRRFGGIGLKTWPEPRADTWLAALRFATTPEVRAFLARQALAAAGESISPALFNELAEADPAVAGLAREKVIRRDPAAYAGTLAEAEIANLTPEETAKLVSLWAERQPRQALDWAMQHGRPETGSALWRLYDQEPQEALALAPKLTPGKERDDAVQSVAAKSTHNGDLTTALSLLPLISDPAKRESTRKFLTELAAQTGAK